MKQIEYWRDITGWEGLYQVSFCGSVRSLSLLLDIKYKNKRIRRKKNGKRLCVQYKYSTTTYPQVSLNHGGYSKTHRVHRLVATTFIGPQKKGLDVCHNNGIKYYNHASNLRYGTRKENMMDAVKHISLNSCGKNGRSVYSSQKINIVRWLLNLNLFSQREIARMTNVGYATVWSVKHGVQWAKLDRKWVDNSHNTWGK